VRQLKSTFSVYAANASSPNIRSSESLIPAPPQTTPTFLPWVTARDVHVAQAEQDNSHGSFVSGLAVRAQKLNHSDDRFPLCSARIVDVVALGKNATTEDKLISSLEQALEKHKHVKVWNLSLGTERCVADRTFSDLSVALDRLQDEYGVTFVVAAGNYRIPPFRGWPPDDRRGRARVWAGKADQARGARRVMAGQLSHALKSDPGARRRRRPRRAPNQQEHKRDRLRQVSHFMPRRSSRTIFGQRRSRLE
jgi:hypothetical protein